jgi:hypothetical protein
MTLRKDVTVWIGAALVGAGLVWLYPLMADQFVLFSDQGQTAAAAAARAAMPWPTLLVVVGAVVVAAMGRLVHGTVAALPLVAVVGAIVMDDTVISFFVYVFTAPVAIGSVLAAAVPLVRRKLTRGALLAGAAVIVVLVVIADVVVLLACIVAVAWIALSELPGGSRSASAVD